MRTKLISVSKFSRKKKKKKSRSCSAVLVSSPVSRVRAALRPNAQNHFQKGLIFKRRTLRRLLAFSLSGRRPRALFVIHEESEPEAVRTG